MQKLKAIIAHQSKARLRLRVPERRHQHHFFAQCCDKIEKWSMVQQVEATPSTASILIKYQGDETSFLRQINSLELDIISPESKQLVTTNAPAWSVITDMFESFNSNIRSSTNSKFDLPSFLFIALLIYGLVQFIRRPAVILGWETAWWFALNVYMMAREQTNNEKVISEDTIS